MKYTPFIAPILVTAVIALNQTFACDSQLACKSNTKTSSPAQRLAESCYRQWLTLDWTLANAEMLARDNFAFNEGVRNICQARAELFFEGYEIKPFIAADSQQEVFPLVFRPNVDAIKSQIRLNLPKLRLI